MTSRTSYILGYTELLSQREPVQQGTRFVHKGLHIFIPVLHYLFLVVLFCRKGYKAKQSISLCIIYSASP